MKNPVIKGLFSHGPATAGSCGRQPALSHARPASRPKPKLLDQVRQALRARHYSRRTEEVP
jgi:hypothetical protein